LVAKRPGGHEVGRFELLLEHGQEARRLVGVAPLQLDDLAVVEVAGHVQTLLVGRDQGLVLPGARREIDQAPESPLQALGRGGRELVVRRLGHLGVAVAHAGQHVQCLHDVAEGGLVGLDAVGEPAVLVELAGEIGLGRGRALVERGRVAPRRVGVAVVEHGVEVGEQAGHVADVDVAAGRGCGIGDHRPDHAARTGTVDHRRPVHQRAAEQIAPGDRDVELSQHGVEGCGRRRLEVAQRGHVLAPDRGQGLERERLAGVADRGHRELHGVEAHGQSRARFEKALGAGVGVAEPEQDAGAAA
jgi:hypothetical protein